MLRVFTQVLLIQTAATILSQAAFVNINDGNIKGTLEISAINHSGTWNISFRFQSLSFFQSNDSVYGMTIDIRSLPPSYHSDCSESDLGAVYDPTGSFNDPNYSETCKANKARCALGDMRNRLGVIDEWANGVTTTFSNNTNYLRGSDSIVGRSLVIYSARGLPITCSVISNRSSVDDRLLRIGLEAKLPGPVAGIVRFVQLTQEKGETIYDTQITVDLFTNDNGNDIDTVRWQLVHAQMNSSFDCQAITDRMLNTTLCTTNPNSHCYSLDLTSKHGTLTVGAAHRRYFFTNTELRLDTLGTTALVVSSVTGRRLSCTNLTPEISVQAVFDGDVNGTITCEPDDLGSRLTVSLSGLNGQAGKYHVYQFPVENADCGSTGDHYNPFQIKQLLRSGRGSPHRYETGDLSGLFGFLTGKDSVNFTHVTPNIQCDGIYGILGRSVVIHRIDGKKWRCATLNPLGLNGSRVTKHSAVARFHGKYEGTVTLTQYTIGPGVETTTIVDANVQQNGPMTEGHKWHVHQDSTAGFTDQTENSENCAARYAGGHYNPYIVDLTARYSSECSPNKQLRCELGDLSGKHRPYSIYPIGSTHGRQLAHDIMLPLLGPNSVLLRSVVFHAANGIAPRIACATLYPEGVKAFGVTFRKPDDVNMEEVHQSLADGLALPVSDILYLRLKTDETQKCVSATFALKDTVASSLPGNSSSIFSNGSFGRLTVDSACLRRAHDDKKYNPMAIVALNGGGLLGGIEIDESMDGHGVSFRLTSFRSSNEIRLRDVYVAIHEYPPQYRSDCTESDVGSVYDPTNAFSIESYSSVCQSDPTLCAVGDMKHRLGTNWSVGRRMTIAFPNIHFRVSSVVGRSLVLYNSRTEEPLTCARIKRRHPGREEPLKEVYLQVELQAPIAGHISFIQPVNRLSGENYATQILVEVFTNSKMDNNETYLWHLSKGKVNTAADCAKLSESARSVGCDVNNTGKCYFTDLTGKHGPLVVPRGRANRLLFIDENLPLQNISGMVLVITDKSGENVNCGHIHPMIDLVATFSGEVKGEVRCTPTYGGSLLSVRLEGMHGIAGGYHIHRYPVNNGDCMSTGGHYNPYNADQSQSPATGLGSYDQYEVGDLSGLFGALNGKTTVGFTRFDANLRCDSILGRSVAIHRTDKKRWQCATFQPAVSDGFTLTRHSALARFAGKYQGYVRLTQWEVESAQMSFFTTTTIDIDIRVNGTTARMTSGHKFHVHEQPTSGLFVSEMGSCHSSYTGSHFNPLSVDLKENYSMECNEQNQLRCEVGDLSKKHGLYTIHPLSDTEGRRLTSDAYLPLRGPNSVVFRSIVLHAANSGSAGITCANLYPEGFKQFSVLFIRPQMIDTSDLQATIAHSLGIGYGDINYLDVDMGQKCVSIKFAIPDHIASRLQGKDFYTSIKARNGNLGNYVVTNEETCLSINSPNASSSPTSRHSMNNGPTSSGPITSHCSSAASISSTMSALLSLLSFIVLSGLLNFIHW